MRDVKVLFLSMLILLSSLAFASSFIPDFEDGMPCDMVFIDIGCDDGSDAAVRYDSCYSDEISNTYCVDPEGQDVYYCCPEDTVMNYPECVYDADCTSTEKCAGYFQGCTGTYSTSTKVRVDGVTSFNWEAGIGSDLVYENSVDTTRDYTCQCSTRDRTGYAVYGSSWYRYDCNKVNWICIGDNAAWEKTSYVGPAYEKKQCSDLTPPSCGGYSSCDSATTFGECEIKCEAAQTREVTCSGSYTEAYTYTTCEGTYSSCDSDADFRPMLAFRSLFTGKVLDDPETCETPDYPCYQSQCESNSPSSCYLQTHSATRSVTCSGLSESACDSHATCTKTITCVDPVCVSEGNSIGSSTCCSGLADSNGYCCPTGEEWDGSQCAVPVVLKTLCEVCDDNCESGLSCQSALGTSTKVCVSGTDCALNTDPSSCSVSSGNVQDLCPANDIYTCSSGTWSTSSCPNPPSPSARWSTDGFNTAANAAKTDPVLLIIDNHDASVTYTIKDGSTTVTTLSGNDPSWTVNPGSVDSGSDDKWDLVFSATADGNTVTSGVLTVQDLSDHCTNGDYDPADGETGVDCGGVCASCVDPCGNGDDTDPGEDCDDGASNGVPCSALYGTTCTYCSSSCEDTVVTGPRCGDGNKDVPPETCSNCVADIGACPPTCNNDGTCAPDDCSTCPTDCGPCAPTEDFYWVSATSPYGKITQTIQLNANDLSGKQFRMLHENYASTSSFELWENDAAGSTLDDRLGTYTGSESGSDRYYTWTTSYSDFWDSASSDSDGIFEFYFEVGSTESEELIIEVTGTIPVCDDGIVNGDETGSNGDGTECGGECGICVVDPCLGKSLCSDFDIDDCSQATILCSDVKTNIEQALGLLSNQDATCAWQSGSCNPLVTTVDDSGMKIGSCSYDEDQSSDSCDDGFLTYLWDADWNWDPNNNYTVNPDAASGDYVLDGGYFHKDPDNAMNSCRPGQRTIPCPAQIQLSFFTWKNLVAAVLLVLIIYIAMANRKNKKPIIKKKAVAKKKTPTKKKVAAIKKSSTKKVSKKKSPVKKKK